MHDFPGGRPLAFAVLPALAIQRLPFPAKRNGGGSFVMVSVAGSPRPHSAPLNPPPFRLATLRQRNPHAFPSPTTVTSKQNIYWPNGTSDSQGHAVSKERSLSPGQTISKERSLSPGHTISEKRAFFARAHYIDKAVSFARARCVERADFFRKGTLYRKSGLFSPRHPITKKRLSRQGSSLASSRFRFA